MFERLQTLKIKPGEKQNASVSINNQLNFFYNNNNFIEILSLYYVCKIWNLWEMVITETPILVYSERPSTCSDVVMMLSSLVYPLEYLGDVRPYLTLFDKDFKDYNDEENLKFTHSSILGIINPFCLKVYHI